MVRVTAESAVMHTVIVALSIALVLNTCIYNLCMHDSHVSHLYFLLSPKKIKL